MKIKSSELTDATSPLKLVLQIGLILLCLLQTGCGSAKVAEEISQNQANEIVALLAGHGISAVAARETGSKARYAVEVKKGFYSQSVALLHEHGLPAEHKPSFSELTAQQGLIPNSREMEALRLDHAIATEIEEILLNHPAVASVRVIVRQNTLRTGQDPSASIVVQQRQGQVIDREEAAQMVSRVVPGLHRENLTLIISAAAAESTIDFSEGAANQGGKVIRVPLVPFLLSWRVPEDDYHTLAIALVIGLVLVGLLGGLIGYWYGYFNQSKMFFESNLPEVSSRQLKLERLRRDAGES